MRFNYSFKNLNYPKKSILNLKLLSSIESSISAYCIFLTVFLLGPYFGVTEKQLIAGSLFKIISYASILILILNLFVKRKEINKKGFLILNLPLFLSIPNFTHNLFKNLFFFIN